MVVDWSRLTLYRVWCYLRHGYDPAHKRLEDERTQLREELRALNGQRNRGIRRVRRSRYTRVR